MKRITLTALCVIFSVALFAQKSLIIHQKDGTKIEIPRNAIIGFNFVGKAVVNDNDYTALSNVTLHSDADLNISFTATFHSEDPYMQTPVYGLNWGILYSTTPNVTVESGTLLKQSNSQTKVVTNFANSSLSTQLGRSPISTVYDVNLEYETDYYIRSFVYRPSNGVHDAECYYSEEVKINTGKPAMAYYGVSVEPERFAETGYIMPTDSAWSALSERAPYFYVKGSCKDALIETWNNYLTAKRIAALKPQCNTVYDCCDGTLYVLDNICDDFIEYAIDQYDDEYTMTGYTEETSSCLASSPAFRVCDETWNVPNNHYWEYEPLSSAAQPKVTYTLKKPLLANYNYKVEITFAPNAAEGDTLATKYNVQFYGMNQANKSIKLLEVKDLQTNVDSITVTTLDSISAAGFGEAELIIKANANRKEIKKVFINTLRIAQIKITPMGPCNKEE